MTLFSVSINPGSTWLPKINEVFHQRGIPCVYDPQQKQDVLVTFLPLKMVAIELKASDLHGSLTGKGEGGSLVWELTHNYLPQRTTKKYNEVWVFVAGYPEPQDGVMLASLMADHRIPYKMYFDMDHAVKGMLRMLDHWEDPIDLALPPYINAEIKINQISRMLRCFKGFTEPHINDVLSRAAFDGKITPAEIFSEIIEKVLKDNLLRLWHDWFWSGIEPEDNLLGKGI